jgi:hypothetical protein
MERDEEYCYSFHDDSGAHFAMAVQEMFGVAISAGINLEDLQTSADMVYDLIEAASEAQNATMQ